MPVETIGNRKVYIDSARTTNHTIKICDPANIRGRYEYYLQIHHERIDFNSLLNKLRDFIKEKESKSDEDDTYEWERNVIKDVVEKMRETYDASEISGQNGTTATESDDKVQRVDLDDSEEKRWLDLASRIVEDCIDQFVREFCDQPYLHRVEHSCHARLYEILVSQPIFRGQIGLGVSEYRSQLVHKEWPETTRRERKRRGSFDLVVLTPGLLEKCGNLDAFLDGLLAPPIVIELGLDYGKRHLKGDLEKLCNSAIRHGFIVHLARDRRETAIDEEIRQLENPPKYDDGCIRTTYCFHLREGHSRSQLLIDSESK